MHNRENNTFRFPIAPLILACIALCCCFLNSTYFPSYTLVLPSSYQFARILSQLVEFSAHILAIIGLIICRKEKNVLVSVGFMIFGGFTLLLASADFFSILNALLETICHMGIGWLNPSYFIMLWLPFLDICVGALLIAIGVCYMIGKPVMRIIKLICAIALMAVLFLEIFPWNYYAYNTPFENIPHYIERVIKSVDFSALIKYVLSSVVPMVAVILYTPFKKTTV